MTSPVLDFCSHRKPWRNRPGAGMRRRSGGDGGLGEENPRELGDKARTDLGQFI
uniref:Uncharacterized protein n=1 Tax=Arundo donax TaxID=35708 RepID=A0A0A9EBV0_ARUDO